MTRAYHDSVFIRKSTKDEALMTHDVKSGKLIRVERERRTGATVTDRKKFDAIAAAQDELADHPLDLTSFLTGLFFGAFCAFALVSVLAFIAWRL